MEWWVWLLISLGGLAGALTLLLSVPFDLTCSLAKEERFQGRARIGWLFGLVGKDLTDGHKRTEEEAERKEDEDKQEERPRRQQRGRQRAKRRWGRPRQFIAMARTRGVISHTLKLVQRLMRATKIRELELDLVFGLGEPAETGQLYGVVRPAAIYVESITPLNISVEPDFQKAILRGSFNASIRIYPIRIIPPLILFVFSLTTLRVLMTMWRARK